MSYKRYDGYINSIPQKLIDSSLPICPFCGESPHWLLDVDKEGFIIEVECMCEKCDAKVKIENNGFSYSKNLLVTDTGKENIHNLSSGNYYNINELSKFAKNEQSTITNIDINKKKNSNRNITICAVVLILIMVMALVGSFLSNKGKSSSDVQVDATYDEYRQKVENLRDDLYKVYKQYVYDQIKSGMYYSDVQKLVDSATRQCKQSLSTLNVQVDLSNGRYFPKWIVTVKTNNSKTYSLFYIEVECATSFQVIHKYMNKYNVS